MPDDNPHSRDSNGRASWLTPQFVWQVLVFVAINLISVVVWGQLLTSDVRSLTEEMSRMRADMQDIRQVMPNSEAYNLRVGVLEKQLNDHGQRIRELEVYNQNMRERLAASGWRRPD